MFLEHFPDEGKNHGWIEVVCGSMFSGKTEELIRRLKRAQFANQKILLVKPKVDDRYHKENVVSHQGNSFDAICVEDSSEILKIWRKEKIVAIDEAQFFDEGIAEVCNDLSKIDFVPAITTWPGELKLTASKVSFPCSSLHISITF